MPKVNGGLVSELGDDLLAKVWIFSVKDAKSSATDPASIYRTRFIRHMISWCAKLIAFERREIQNMRNDTIA